MIQRLAKEVRDLSHAPPDGIAFVPNDDETLMEVCICCIRIIKQS